MDEGLVEKVKPFFGEPLKDGLGAALNGFAEDPAFKHIRDERFTVYCVKEGRNRVYWVQINFPKGKPMDFLLMRRLSLENITYQEFNLHYGNQGDDGGWQEDYSVEREAQIKELCGEPLGTEDAIKALNEVFHFDVILNGSFNTVFRGKDGNCYLPWEFHPSKERVYRITEQTKPQNLSCQRREDFAAYITQPYQIEEYKAIWFRFRTDFVDNK